MNATVTRPRRILWPNVLTVVSATILIGAEVFGAAFAGGWAVENITGFGTFLIRMAQSIVSLVGLNLNAPSSAGVHLLQAIFFIIGVLVMAAFMRTARRVEPFTVQS